MNASHETTDRRVRDFMYNLVSSRTANEVREKTVREIGTVIPHDSVVCLFDGCNSEGKELGRALAGGRPDIRMLATSPGFEALMDEYNGYYWRLQPPPPPGVSFMLHLDWSDWRHYPYYTEFVRRSDVKYSLMPFDGLQLNVTIHRSRAGGNFSETEEKVFGLLVRHVSRIHELIGRVETLERFTRPALADTQCASITPRETDIVRLLLLRLTVPQIATVLSISPRTVEQHIVHLYEKCGAWDRQSLLQAVLANDSSTEQRIGTPAEQRGFSE